MSDDGSVLAVGATYNDGIGSDSVHVRVYENKNGSWEQIGQDLDGENAHDWSGHSVALSDDGSILAVGAHGNDGNGNRSGHVGSIVAVGAIHNDGNGSNSGQVSVTKREQAIKLNEIDYDEKKNII